MRFIHTADWHIGKKLHGYDLLEDQRAIIDQIIAIALEEKPLPSSLQVICMIVLFPLSMQSNYWMKIAEINLTNELPLLAISGNHDSPTRLKTDSQWFQQTRFTCPPASNKVCTRLSLTIHNSFYCLISNRLRRAYFWRTVNENFR